MKPTRISPALGGWRAGQVESLHDHVVHDLGLQGRIRGLSESEQSVTLLLETPPLQQSRPPFIQRTAAHGSNTVVTFQKKTGERPRSFKVPIKLWISTASLMRSMRCVRMNR